MVGQSPAVYATVIAAAAVILAAAAESLHFIRILRAAPLAFSSRSAAVPIATLIAIIRVVAVGLVVWGLALLLFLKPSTYQTAVVNESDFRHLILVLDVSPSMSLEDAGPGGKQRRNQRAADIIQSFFERVQAERYKTTIIAVYTEAKPVVKDTADREVIRNILTDLPMSHAFKSGETNIFSGLEEAAKIAKSWSPGSAVLMLVTDGDTIPATGMPKMPPSIGNNVVVVGLGNPAVGKSISGHLSRQDVSTLRQIATRLSGIYHDGNDKQLATDLIRSIDQSATRTKVPKRSLREWALLAIGIGGGTLVLLPFMLSLIGTGWTPGRHPRLAKVVQRSRTQRVLEPV